MRGTIRRDHAYHTQRFYAWIDSFRPFGWKMGSIPARRTACPTALVPGRIHASTHRDASLDTPKRQRYPCLCEEFTCGGFPQLWGTDGWQPRVITYHATPDMIAALAWQLDMLHAKHGLRINLYEPRHSFYAFDIEEGVGTDHADIPDFDQIVLQQIELYPCDTSDEVLSHIWYHDAAYRLPAIVARQW